MSPTIWGITYFAPSIHLLLVVQRPECISLSISINAFLSIWPIRTPETRTHGPAPAKKSIYPQITRSKYAINITPSTGIIKHQHAEITAVSPNPTWNYGTLIFHTQRTRTRSQNHVFRTGSTSLSPHQLARGGFGGWGRRNYATRTVRRRRRRAGENSRQTNNPSEFFAERVGRGE